MRTLTKALIAVGILLLASPAFALTLNVGDVVPNGVNELPLYGGIQKNAEMQKADEQFTASAAQAAGSAEKASAYAVGKAWEAFQDMKLNEAMKRANQAWLLDNNNYESYWVMAIIQIFRGAPKEEVTALFEQALAKADSSNNARLTQDYQTFLSGQENHSIENLAQIKEQYQMARKALLGN